MKSYRERLVQINYGEAVLKLIFVTKLGAMGCCKCFGGFTLGKNSVRLFTPGYNLVFGCLDEFSGCDGLRSSEIEASL